MPDKYLTLNERFKVYDAENPEIWLLFVRFSFTLIDCGYKVLSASLVSERIRWETTVVTTGEFKFSNNFKPCYARKFNRVFSDAAGQFKLHQSQADGP